MQALLNTTTKISGDFENDRADELIELITKYGGKVANWNDKEITIWYSQKTAWTVSTYHQRAYGV